MSDCCSDPACKRTQPIQVMRSALTSTWYVVTRWKAIPDRDDVYTALEKHRLPDEIQESLTKWADRPQPGDRVEDGGLMGTLVRCPECSGDGLLHQPDPGQLRLVTPQVQDAP